MGAGLVTKKLLNAGADSINGVLESANISKRLSKIDTMKEVAAKNKEFYGARAQEVRAMRTEARIDAYQARKGVKLDEVADQAGDLDQAAEVLDNGSVGSKNGIGGFISNHPYIAAGIAGGVGLAAGGFFGNDDE